MKVRGNLEPFFKYHNPENRPVMNVSFKTTADSLQ